MALNVGQSLARALGDAGLPKRVLKRLTELGRVRHLSSGTFLFKEGDVGDSAFLVLQGGLAVRKRLSDEEDVHLGVRGPGEWIGEMSVLDGEGRSATVVADGRAAVLEIPRDAFLELLRAEPALGGSIARLVGGRLRETGAALLDALRKRNEALTDQNSRLSREISNLSGPLEIPTRFEVVPGRSAAARRTRLLARRAVGTDLPLLLIGSEGSGRSELARRIHAESSRRSGPLVSVHCDAVSPVALEPVLFGEVGRGRKARGPRALVEAAERGSLLLEDVERLSPWIQGLLLRLVERGEYLPVGATVPRRANCRLIAIAGPEIIAGVEQGWFRPDLFNALSGHRIDVPSLQERRVDAPLILEDFLLARARDLQVEPMRLSRSASEALASYACPASLRELLEEAERLFESKSPGSEITARDLSPAISGLGPSFGYSEAVRAFKSQFLDSVLEDCAGDRAEAALRLGLHPSNLLRMLRELGLERWTEGRVSLPRSRATARRGGSARSDRRRRWATTSTAKKR
jgi:DNA-binding NtrC family response regulator